MLLFGFRNISGSSSLSAKLLIEAYNYYISIENERFLRKNQIPTTLLALIPTSKIIEYHLYSPFIIFTLINRKNAVDKIQNLVQDLIAMAVVQYLAYYFNNYSLRWNIERNQIKVIGFAIIKPMVGFSLEEWLKYNLKEKYICVYPNESMYIIYILDSWIELLRLYCAI